MTKNTENIFLLLENIIEWGKEQKNSNYDHIELLIKQLSEVNILIIELEDMSDDLEYPEPPKIEIKTISINVEKNFPKFSLYNISSDVSINICEAGVIIGDAIDDLTDIIIDFMDIIWYYKNTTVENAVWYMKFGYTAHWGKHLNDLLYYLYHLRCGR